MQECPQTYKTILGEIYSSTDTRARILRRKLNKDFYSGFLSKCIVPGIATKCMFYPIDKSYTIFIARDGFYSSVYYCFEYKTLKSHIRLYDARRLYETHWVRFGDVSLRRDSIIKIL